MEHLAASPVLLTPPSRRIVLPVLFGLAAAGGLLGFYLGILSLAQGWSHATQQVSEDGRVVIAIASGFGVQVGLFSYMRGLRMHGHASGVATSTGTSSVAMLACCAHHVSDLLPVLGLSGAAIFLNAYRTPLLWLGVLMNLAGIAYLVLQLQRRRVVAGAKLAFGLRALPQGGQR